MHSGPLTITQAGYLLQNTEVDGCLTVNALNVTIKNVLVKAGDCYWPIYAEGAGPTTITDTEIDGLNNTSGDAGIACQNCSLTRVNIHGTIDGMKASDSVSVRDSYIHDLAMTSDSHNDGIQTLGTSLLSIVHNTIISPPGSTSAVILSTGSADEMRNVTIDDNLLGGGAYTVYAGYQAGVDTLSKVSNIRVTDNIFSRQIYPKSGYYGPITSDDPPVVVSGNEFDNGVSIG